MIEQIDSDTEKYWEAVQTRAKDWDGSLFYAVVTTGIYCRPSCPSRRPLRSSIQFFTSAHAAEEAGFRACKRCHPDQADKEKTEWQYFLHTLNIPANEIYSVKEWATAVNTSPDRLRKILSKYSGITPREALTAKRMNEFKKNIQAGENIISSQFSAGFGSSSRLYEKAVSHFGMTPGKYQKGGDGMTIHYAFLDIPVGIMIIAATKQGVCSIQIGKSKDEILDGLKKEFPRAEIVPHSGELSPWIDQLEAYFTGFRKNLDIPLDLLATTFQLRVWHELRKIPYGETRSYSQVAESLGQPTASRAVASACAKNPVAIVTPCHRVIHGDGSISGYRWGLERKKALLALEKGEE